MRYEIGGHEFVILCTLNDHAVGLENSSVGDFFVEPTKIEEWETDVTNLNNRINALPEWNDHAEYLQRQYDQLLENRPKDEEC